MYMDGARNVMNSQTAQGAQGQRYSSLAVRLHWIVALLVGLQFLLKGAMVSTMTAIRADLTPATVDYLLANLHVLSGLTIGGLMVWRLNLRLQRDSKPADDHPETVTSLHAPATAPATEARAETSETSTPSQWQVMFKPLAKCVHWAFYVLLLLLPISGLLAYYEVSLAASVHRGCQRLLLVLLFMHILAALIHHFLRHRTGKVN